MNTSSPPTESRRSSVRKVAIASVAIFLVALGVRLLSWHDTRVEVLKVQSVVVADYQRTARLLREGSVGGYLSASGPLADPNLLGHPPGYPITVTLVWALLGESNTAIQVFQITCDSLAAVLIFLIAIELLPFGVGLIAGLLVALAPQFTWNSVLLLPDTLAVLPLLAAIYFLSRAMKKPRFVTVMAAGVFVGLSCWLRANALLMAPFLALLVLLLFDRLRRWRYAGALLAGAVLVVAPLTIRNWIVFHHFIPVSLGAGQTMLEGIADYDPDRRFGIPNTDMEIMKMEAEQFNRPDYYSTLFSPDGFKRERWRLARGFNIVRDNPVWFLSVMVRRAGSMLRLERARLISSTPPVTHLLGNPPENQRTWVANALQLQQGISVKSPAAEVVVSTDNQTLRLISDNSKYGNQLTTAPIAVQPNRDYLFRLPVMVEEGRMTVNVVGTQAGKTYASSVVETAEVKEGHPQPSKTIELPFVSNSAEAVQLVFQNASPQTGHSVVNIGQTELFELGPASFIWTRYPRLLMRGLQKLFITAIILPLALVGAGILLWRRAWKTLLLLLGVPAYYLCVQSLLHTEYRYVLAIHYFLFVLVAVALYEFWRVVLTKTRRLARPGSFAKGSWPA